MRTASVESQECTTSLAKFCPYFSILLRSRSFCSQVPS